MTLLKQVAFVLSFLLLVILTTVMYLNFKSANESIQHRLYEDAQNTAASLSLSLGTSGGDIPTMETMINANFDSGNYAFIALNDIDGNVLYKREKEGDSKIDDVPKWFRELVNIEAPIASANVSSGWSVVGVLHVQSDDTYAYQQLYTIVKNLFFSFIIIYVIALVIINAFLAFLLKPLKKIQKQAEAITKNEFIINEDIPFTKEFRDVVVVMNTMVKKVKMMFEKANEELKKLKEKEYVDSVTKLYNRKYLINKLPEYLKIDAPSKDGMAILIAFDGVIEANKKIGYKNVDKFFFSLRDLFYQFVKKREKAIIARMNGTEFFLFIPDMTEEELQHSVEFLQEEIQKLLTSFGLDTDETFASIGVYHYSNRDSISELLSLTDQALAKAKLSPEHFYFVAQKDFKELMSKDAWREVLHQAIEEESFEIVSYNVVDSRNKQIVHENLTLNLVTADKVYTYGEFIAPAMQIGLVDEIYKKFIEMLLSQYNEVFESKKISLRLSYEFLEDEKSILFLQDCFKNYAKGLRFELVMEIPDKFIVSHYDKALLLYQLFQQYHLHIGIFEFIGESGDYHYLQELKPQYIKSEKEFFLTQDIQSLNALKLLCNSIDIDLIASGVMDKETLEALQEKEIFIVQGKVVELIV